MPGISNPGAEHIKAQQPAYSCKGFIYILVQFKYMNAVVFSHLIFCELFKFRRFKHACVVDDQILCSKVDKIPDIFPGRWIDAIQIVTR